jgi:hypothetical protein
VPGASGCAGGMGVSPIETERYWTTGGMMTPLIGATFIPPG